MNRSIQILLIFLSDRNQRLSHEYPFVKPIRKEHYCKLIFKQNVYVIALLIFSSLWASGEMDSEIYWFLFYHSHSSLEVLWSKIGDSGWGNQKRKAQGFYGMFRYKMNINDFEVSLETGLRRKQEEPTVHGAQVATTGEGHLTKCESRSKVIHGVQCFSGSLQMGLVFLALRRLLSGANQLETRWEVQETCSFKGSTNLLSTSNQKHLKPQMLLRSKSTWASAWFQE